jgi:hypothetical protein
MRHLVLAAGAVCAAGWLAARVEGQGQGMPGQVVGTGFTVPGVGTSPPRAAPPAGQRVGTTPGGPMSRPYDPSRPLDQFKGTNLDPQLVAAPVQGFGDQSAFDKLYAKMRAMIGLPPTVGPTVTRPNYTPGIARRNRERAEQRMWRRD